MMHHIFYLHYFVDCLIYLDSHVCICMDVLLLIIRKMQFCHFLACLLVIKCMVEVFYCNFDENQLLVACINIFVVMVRRSWYYFLFVFDCDGNSYSWIELPRCHCCSFLLHVHNMEIVRICKTALYVQHNIILLKVHRLL